MTSREPKDITGVVRHIEVYDYGSSGWIGLVMCDDVTTLGGHKSMVVSPAELAEALNEIVPGFKASYEPPRPKNVDVVRQLPVGSVFRWSDTDDGYAYIKATQDEYPTTDPMMRDVFSLKHFDHGDGQYHIEVIYRPEGVDHGC